MKLFLMRHANASQIFPDSARPLSETGRLSIKTLCQNLEPSDFSGLTRIWHSPYLRATETAKIFAAQMHLTQSFDIAEHTRPEDNPYEFARLVASFTVFEGDLMLVSHNPFVETLSDILTGAHSRSAIFKTGTLARYELKKSPCAEIPYGLWRLESIVSPASLF